MDLGSKSIFFFQSASELAQYRTEMIDILIIGDFVEDEIEYYLEAYDYFVVNPERYDGATATEDLNDIPGLEIDSMSHDCDYVKHNVGASFKYKRMSDKIMLANMKRNGKSSFERNWRAIRLWALSYFVLWPLWNGRKITIQNKKYMDDKYKVFVK